MAEEQMHPNQVGDAAPGTRLPEDPAIAELADHGREDFLAVLRDHPASSLCWALLAEGALLAGTEEADVAGYAYAVTGVHQGMDALRRSGWNEEADEAGTIPWEHLANQGFLRCVWARSVAAGRIGQDEEARHWEEFLHRVSESGWQALHTTLSLPDEADTGNGVDVADSEDIDGVPRDDEEQTTAAEPVGSTFQG
ncbi:MAG: DUF3151 family protein [Acidipropionibacterium sp.]|jgi:hypothetical protein|nr:DUF3151 family protein [Acidipropionibacterium sp.]